MASNQENLRPIAGLEQPRLRLNTSALAEAGTLARHAAPGQFNGMKNDIGPLIDMTPEGKFSNAGNFGPSGYAAARSSLPLGMVAFRLAGFAILLGLSVLAFWLAVFTLPLLFLGGLILYGVYRYQLARLRKQGSFAGFYSRNPFIVIRR